MKAQAKPQIKAVPKKKNQGQSFLNTQQNLLVTQKSFDLSPSNSQVPLQKQSSFTQEAPDQKSDLNLQINENKQLPPQSPLSILKRGQTVEAKQLNYQILVNEDPKLNHYKSEKTMITLQQEDNQPPTPSLIPALTNLRKGSGSLAKNFLLKAGEKLIEDSRGNTKVVARFRPMNELEQQLLIQANCKIEFPFNNSVDIIQDGISNSFTLDQIFPMESKQSDIFNYLGEAIINDIMTGFNGTIFAYGQTGAGKTHSMMGPDIYDEELQGVIPRAVHAIFERIQNSEIEIDFTLSCSMLEIYKEQLRDLFQPDQGELKIKDSPHRGIYVEGLTENCVINAEEMFEWIEIGNGNRIVASTGMNKQSSRSHSLFILEVQQKLPNGSEKKGLLNLVDLAGSEKISKSKVVGENLEEAKKINLSLSALGNVIHALTTNSDHIPYRDSKLTRLLQQSLGGNFKTSLIVACSPHPHNFEETMSTLKFAQRAKSVKNKPRANIKRSPAYYQKIIDQLKQELALEKEKVLALSDQLNMNPEQIKQIMIQVQNQEIQNKQSKALEIKIPDLLKIPSVSQQNINSPITPCTPLIYQTNTFFDQSFSQDVDQGQGGLECPQSPLFEGISHQNSLYQFSQQKEMLEMKIQNFKSENSALENEVKELKDEKEQQDQKIEKLKFQLIEAENKYLKLQTDYEQINIKYAKEKEINKKLQDTEKGYLEHVNTLTRFLNEQDVEVQKLISQKVQRDFCMNEVSLACFTMAQQKCLSLQEALKENEENFSLQIDDLAHCLSKKEKESYNELVQKETEHGISLEQLRYRHRQKIQEASMHNTQLIHILYAMSWRYENQRFLLNIKDLEIKGLKRSIKELEITISNLSQQHKRMSHMIDSFKRMKIEQNVIKQNNRPIPLPRQFRMIRKIARDQVSRNTSRNSFSPKIIKVSTENENIVNKKTFSKVAGEQKEKYSPFSRLSDLQASSNVNVIQETLNEYNDQNQDIQENPSNNQDQEAHNFSPVFVAKTSQPEAFKFNAIQNQRRGTKSKTLAGLTEMDANEVKLMLQNAQNMRLSTELQNSQQQLKILEIAFNKVSEKFETSLNLSNKNWILHFRKMKSIYGHELKRKQKQIVKMHETLSKWMNQVVDLQSMDFRTMSYSRSMQSFTKTFDMDILAQNKSFGLQNQELQMEQKAFVFCAEIDKQREFDNIKFSDPTENETDKTFLFTEEFDLDKGFEIISPKMKVNNLQITKPFGEEENASQNENQSLSGRE